ncbi:hypothetical protein SKAU_G00267690 [Synaphobranchus kaupii]|uniref:Sodium/calcium exchanger membrane region domain-containing protein n=1 Tax=Synaphobranchus kaupii TaxID=118154 RepID=A0A9Q1IPC8_SYNKA|nr:hypothetical protein SKAU_G00267690 [Synaphobranchus kaupii]
MKAVFRSRRRRLCCCGMGMLAVLALTQLLRLTETDPGQNPPSTWATRRLMQEKGENQTSEPSHALFPEDIFTKEQRKRGAVLLHVLCAVYMFYALAIVCDEYFVPSLEKISKNLHLSEDVAGATFMAAGSSAPEMFTSLIGVFITKGDVGVGTIVGSAVFNILVIIGVCGIFAGQSVSLTWWPLFRDSLFYIFSVLALIVVIYDEIIVWWESVLLITMYGVYILIMKFNLQIWRFVEDQCRGPHLCYARNSRHPDRVLGEGGENCDTSDVLLRKGQCPGQESPVVMVDELLSLHPHQLMAGRMLINERQRLIRSPGGSSDSDGGIGDSPVKACGSGFGPDDSLVIENGRSPENEMLPLEEAGRGEADDAEGVTGESNVESPCPEEEEDDEEGTFRPHKMPRGGCARVKWLVSWPLSLLLYCTVPNCVLPRWHRWFMVTFVGSTLWIAAFSYLMVWMVIIISSTLGIPTYIMGITFLAAGTSVPDCMASLIVARQGMGDMAVSNSIGSNIFDILLGLGFPWTLRTLVVDFNSSVSINNKGLVYSVILLLASVCLTVLSVHLNRWKLDKRLGFSLLFLYVIFLLCSVLFGL